MVYGGSGADRIVFGAGTGHDIAADFEVGTDRLALAGVAAAQLTFAAAFDASYGAGVMVSAGADTIFLKGATLDQISASTLTG